LKLGINFEAVRGMSDAEYIKTIADLGFSATFTDMTQTKNVLEIAELCQSHGIAYETIHAPLINVNSIWQDGINGDEVLKIITDCVNTCSTAKVPYIIVHLTTGCLPPDISTVGCERIKNLIDFANEKQVKIAFENLRALPHLDWAMNEFKSNDVVGFCWDLGHENCFTRKVDFLSLYGDRLICTHIHDNYKRRWQDKHILPFDGRINYKKAAKNLKNTNFNGTLMLEVFAENHRRYNRLTPQEFLLRAHTAIKRFDDLINK
jgi:sugar phosphate isomerase/epimerase